MPPTQSKPRTVDEYLARLNEDQRAALEKVRRTIHAVAPGAEECISYGLAAFRLNGRMLVAFGAWARHCALYPMSAATVKKFQHQITGFETTKGTIRFSTEKPLPISLLKRLLAARVTENRLKAKSGRNRKR